MGVIICKDNKQRNDCRQTSALRKSVKVKTLAKCCKSKTIISTENIRDIYDIYNQVIGAGQFGSVRLGSLKIYNKKRFAIKSISKIKYEEKENLDQMINELEILKQCDHPHIIKFYETYQDQQFLHLVMEYCGGGQLQKLMSVYQSLGEEQVESFMLNIFSSLAYLHSRGIVHRDIKLDNFVYYKNGNQNELKVIDFGLSEILDEEEDLMKKFAGSFIYVAPEVINGNYTNKCDCWSSGIVMYYMLIGKPPFIDADQDRLIKIIKKGQFDQKNDKWKALSKQTKDFIQKLLEIDYTKRLSATEALSHPYFNKKQTQKQKDLNLADEKQLRQLLVYQRIPNFKKEVCKILVGFLSDEETIRMKTLFKTLDFDNDGVLSDEDLEGAYKSKLIDVDKNQIQNMIQNIENSPESTFISYTNFLIALIHINKKITNQQINLLFKYFDCNKKGVVTQENLINCLARLGRQLPDEELNALISQVDITDTRNLNFHEFEVMMKYDDIKVMRKKYVSLTHVEVDVFLPQLQIIQQTSHSPRLQCEEEEEKDNQCKNNQVKTTWGQDSLDIQENCEESLIDEGYKNEEHLN